MRTDMLIELWERLRGYHKWPQAEATVEFVKQEHTYHDSAGKELHYSYTTGDRLVWVDSGGEKRSAPFTPPGKGKDPKFQFAEGETATIRYNPANPEQYFFPRLSAMRVRYFVSTALTISAVAIFCVGYVWVREMLGCSR
jgi:hypothetical protein